MRGVVGRMLPGPCAVLFAATTSRGTRYIAVTSGLRADKVQKSVQAPHLVPAEYADQNANTSTLIPSAGRLGFIFSYGF